MPATYSHKHTSAQILDSYRARYQKKSGPPKPPKQKKYYVLGVEVDRETYWRYEARLYTINGDICGEFNCSMLMLQQYATEEHAKEYPNEAAAARKILDQIREDITTKGENTVKTKKKSRDFIDALNDIYTESRTAYVDLQNKLAKANAWMEVKQAEARGSNQQNRQLAEIRFVAAKEEYKAAQDEARKEVRDIQDSFSQKVRELREQFKDYLDEHYSASPDKLDAATVQLLNSGICAPSELARLAEKSKDNPTMLRLIASHAEKIMDDRTQSRADWLTCKKLSLVADAAKDGGREMNIFDSAASTAERGLQTNAAVADRMHNHIVSWFDSFRDQMDSVPNAPAEIAAGAEQRRLDQQNAEHKAIEDDVEKARSEHEEDQNE